MNKQTDSAVSILSSSNVKNTFSTSEYAETSVFRMDWNKFMFTWVLLASVVGDVEGVAVDDEVSHAAHETLAEGSGPQSGRHGHGVRRRAQASHV